MQEKLSVVDLFAGAGGLSEGFHRQGFDIIAYVEMNKYACETLLTRHTSWELNKNGQTEVYLNYLKGKIEKQEFYKSLKIENPVINAKISDKTIPMITKTIREKMAASNIQNIDIFIGGPPCQAYSLVGRARDKGKMRWDSRKRLYQYYVKLLNEFKPKMFVFENVPGILSVAQGKLWEKVKKYFENAGYDIDFRILDSSNFMVLQKRKRVILIGWKKDSKLKYPEFEIKPHKYVVKDILSDLPALLPGKSIDYGEYASEPTEYLKMTGIRNNGGPLIQHTTRTLNKNDAKIYRIALEKWKKERVRLNYRNLPEKLKTHDNEESFLDRFKVVAEDMPYSHTLVAHIAKDGHYYIHPDENQLRSISVREAARIQSFPDDYKFEGPRTAQFTQIGNAVPPLMAEEIAAEIRNALKNI
jgi:DNA (cytosine-5)-methyltransferase 1